MLLALVACSQTQLSHTDTAKVVVESFYSKDDAKLKKHTTTDSYASFMSIQNIVTSIEPETKISKFKVLNETIDGDIAWVKFTTTYQKKPETFKLTKSDGAWKVMRKEVREKAPF
ncbi:DUF4878 domain-containing protein [Lacinutrix algicola]|uniref:DUF4878 domain-containing protein n=1 Tax=Lacinutrix algicola TaxID=342954 RepID=UPI0006E2CE6E|nr:DUF4878 domain-containing protein [Lacinutrix algicola]